MRNIKIASFALALLLTAALIPFGSFSAKAEGEKAAPVIEKPVLVTVTDETGTPKAGATVQVIDSNGDVVETVTNADETFTVFLPAGTYTLKITKAPDGFLPPAEDATITVELTEAEERDDLNANTVYDNSHGEICVPNYPNGSHVGIERYTVLEPEGSVTAWCFNQNYDNPYASAPSWNESYDPDDHQYKRLVGTPELLFDLAQNKNDDITAQELYDHILSIMYRKDAVQSKYGFDDALIEFIAGRAIKNFTDPKCFIQFDDNGTSLRYKDENGNWAYRPGGTVWGSVVNHAKGNHQKINLNEVYPDYYAAYRELIDSAEHPSDYYLYIYYPHNFEAGNTDTDQCLLSAFTVPPVRTTLRLREATKIEITKTWADANDQDGYRPTAAEYTGMVHLLANGTDVTETYQDNRTVTDNGDGTYTVKFTDLPKHDESDAEIEYKIKEDNVPKYKADKTEAKDGETITNRHTPETVDIPVEKIWQDNKNADGVRPEKITVHLLADGTEIESVDITPDADGNWKHTFKDLPKNKDHGTEIKYTITEDPVPEYETEIENYTITNKHGPETVEKTVTKEWDDAENVDGVRPESITVHLSADGKEVASATITPDEDGKWEYTFTDLPKNREGGGEIEYTVTEDPVPEYEAEIENLHITNKHVPETVEIPIEKKWDDEENRDGVRPESITVRLYADGEEVASAEVKPDENGDWTYTFTDLPKYKEQGVEIEYTVDEDPVSAYEKSVDGYVITNKHVSERIDIEGKKTWDDEDDKNEMRPVKITIRLFADGNEIDAKTVTEKDGWAWKWKDLPKYKDGKEIRYTIKEDRVKSYLTKIEGFDVTNTYTTQTGDVMQPWLWIALLGVALLLGGGLLVLEWLNKRTA